MLISAVSVLVVAQSSSEIPEGLMNNPVFTNILISLNHLNLTLAWQVFKAKPGYTFFKKAKKYT